MKSNMLENAVIASRIRESRVEAGLTQKRLIDELNMLEKLRSEKEDRKPSELSYMALSRWERGASTPRKHASELLAAYFKKPLSYFFVELSTVNKARQGQEEQLRKKIVSAERPRIADNIKRLRHGHHMTQKALAAALNEEEAGKAKKEGRKPFTFNAAYIARLERGYRRNNRDFPPSIPSANVAELLAVVFDEPLDTFRIARGSGHYPSSPSSEILPEHLGLYHEKPVYLEMQSGEGRYALVNYTEQEFLFSDRSRISFDDFHGIIRYYGPSPFRQSLTGVGHSPLKPSDLQDKGLYWLEMLERNSSIRGTYSGWYEYNKDCNEFVDKSSSVRFSLRDYGTVFLVFDQSITTV